MRPFRSFLGRFALPLGVLVASGAAFVPLGCGSSQSGSGSAVVGATDVDMPDGLARQIRTCAANHRLYEKSGKLAAVFDVTLASDGEVTSVAVRDSTLADESLEACMAKALQSLSESDLRSRRSADPPLGSVAPESRGFLGQTQALGCLATPPCLLAVAFFIGAAYVAVQIYVHAAQSSTAKPRPRPITTAVPTTTAIPASPGGVDCKKQKEICIEHCSDTALPSGDGGFRYWNCFNACMEAAGC
jgi:hypothetical protein